MKPRILVVEDDLDMFNALAARLVANGFDPVQATDVAASAAIIRAEPPDLIILDLGLSDAAAYSVMESLKLISVASPIPVIVLTARDPESEQERSFRGGAYDCLQKPVNEEWLMESIRRAIAHTVPED